MKMMKNKLIRRCLVLLLIDNYGYLFQTLSLIVIYLVNDIA